MAGRDASSSSSSTAALARLDALAARGPRWPSRRTAAFARRLAAHLDAGLQGTSALEGARPPARGERIARALARSRAGEPFADALAELELFSPQAMAWIRAFETAGRLPRALERVAAAIEGDLTTLAELAGRAAYPLFVIHLVPLALAAPALVRGDFTAALLAGLWPYALVWSALGALLWWLLARGGREARAPLAWPLLGPLLRARGMQLYFDSVAALYGAGISIAAAHAGARERLPHRALRELLEPAGEALRAGRSYGEALALTGALRPHELDHLATGERTGQLEAALEALARLARADAEARARAAVRGIGGALYALAVILVSWSVLSFYATLYGGLSAELR